MPPAEETKNEAAILGEEPDTSRSLAATLRLATAKGYVDKSSKRKQAKPADVISSTKKAKLEVKSFTIEEKKDERRDYGSRSHYRGASSSFKDPEDYKPEINLEYTDDSGRRLETPKDAFRYMCYKFHGKGPGKNKIDKRLRKQALESKLKQAQSTDGLTPSTSQMISKQKELNAPYIVLSKGK